MYSKHSSAVLAIAGSAVRCNATAGRSLNAWPMFIDVETSSFGYSLSKQIRAVQSTSG